MRLFLAVNLPSDLRERIYADAAPLRAIAPAVTWVRVEHLHMTVKFLGEVDGSRVDGLLSALRTGLAAHDPFSLGFSGLGAFPDFRRPRVVWIGVRNDRAIAAVASDIEGICESLGFARDERAFNAHLTLGRVKRELAPGQVRALEGEATSLVGMYDVDVRSIELVKSELGSHGPTHSILSSILLGARLGAGGESTGVSPGKADVRGRMSSRNF